MLLTDFDYLKQKFNSLPCEAIKKTVSEWAEEKRFLPKELSPRPGFWDNSWNPHFIEIMDCLGDDSYIQELWLMKSAQIGATTAAENWIGYTIDESPTSFMYLTADDGLAETAMTLKVDALINHCGLSHLIKANTPNTKRSGNTKLTKEFPGGFIKAVGANAPGKLRAISVQRFYADELDGMPDRVGDEGDPVKLAEKRTNAYGRRRKKFFTSTPTIKQTSKISAGYETGDKRQRFVPCPHCNHMQTLVMKGKHEDGRVYGLYFEIDSGGRLKPETVVYVCMECGGFMKEHHKPQMFLRAEWRPTALAKNKFTRSYHINALYSPITMFSWIDIANEFVDCFNIKNGRVKDIEKYQVFQNTILGIPWEERGEAPSYERVIAHRRGIYRRNEIPNHYALQETGSNILMLTMTADVHKERIDVEVLGWCKDGRSYSIDWRHLEGDTDNLQGSAWVDLRELIENTEWVSDDDRRYRVMLTLVDAGYRTDSVKKFCEEYACGVIPIFGRDTIRKTSSTRNFYFHEKTYAADVNVTLYKDRLAAWLRSDWNDGELQPMGYPNYPEDYGDDYFREYEAEHKVVQKHSKTGQVYGYSWEKLPNKDNHAWDCRVYNMAALDMFALEILRDINEDPKLTIINYAEFWEWAIENGEGLLWHAS